MSEYISSKKFYEEYQRLLTLGGVSPCNPAGNTKRGSIIVPLTSCLAGLESAVCQLMTIFVFICKTDYLKPVKQEVNRTVILPPLVFPGSGNPGTKTLLRNFNQRNPVAGMRRIPCARLLLYGCKLGTVFTTISSLCNLRIGLISLSVCPWQAFPA
jgi:hypothetical protein